MTADETTSGAAESPHTDGCPAANTPAPSAGPQSGPPPATGAPTGAPTSGGGGAKPDKNEQIKEIAKALARAEAMKPLEGPITDVYSDADDKKAARQKLKDAYAAAIAKDGPLRAKFDAAKKSFDRAATDMNRGNGSVLDSWLEYAFGADGPFGKLLDEREALKPKFTEPGGPNQKDRAEKEAAVKKWAARYADWSAPVDRITAQIARYAEKIDKLNADINNEVNLNASMTTFWFEVAPLHLQLESAFAAGVKDAVDKAAAKLAKYSDLKGILKIGPERDDESLYLVATADDAENKRRAVLDKWKAAAEAQADAEAAFKLKPDDLATFKLRWDKLKDDAWVAEARKIPEPSKS